MQTLLQIITLSETGGAQKIVYSLLKGLRKQYNLVLVCAPGGELVEQARSLGVKVYEVTELQRAISPRRDFIALKRIYSIIKKEKVDIVHCHSWKGGVVGRIAARSAGCKNTYFTVHGWSLLNSNSKLVKAMYWTIEKLLGYITKKIVCVCEQDRLQGIQMKIARKDKFITIYNGIEERYSTLSDELSYKLALNIEPEYRCLQFTNKDTKKKDSSIIIGTVGRLAPQKRVFETFKIIEKIIRKHTNVKLIWLGDGPQFEEAKVYVAEKGLGNYIELVGNKQDVYPYLEQMDIFLLLSNYEGLPVSILEAMDVSLPVIASDVGGIREQVIDEETGFIVSNDECMIIEKLLLLIENKKRCKTLGESGKQLLHSRFTVQYMLQKYNEIYG